MVDLPKLDDPEYIKARLKELPLFKTVSESIWKAGQREFKDALDLGRLRFRFASDKEVVIRQGDLDTEFYVVLEGMATAYRAEVDGTTSNVGSYGAGDWFGEMAAISHQPRSATIKANGPTVLLQVDVSLFQRLYSPHDPAQQPDATFKKLIDERYRARALESHLKTAPLFKALGRDELKKIASFAELVTFKKDETIGSKGEEAKAVFLIRNGMVKSTDIDAVTKKEVVQGYFGDNSSFGEVSLTEGGRWKSTYTAMTRVDVVKLAKQDFESNLSSVEKTRVFSLAQQATMGGTGTNGDPGAPVDPSMELLVGREVAKAGAALMIDLTKCTRCNACVESCVAVHEDRVPRLSKSGIRLGNDVALASACYHCKTPTCMLACAFGAIRRDVNGQIQIVLDNCVGCGKCEPACPFDVIRMANLLASQSFKSRVFALLKTIPIVGRIFDKKDKTAEAAPMSFAEGKPTEKKAIKCDLCAGLPFEACVYNCPCNAINRVNPSQLVGAGDLMMSK